MSENKTPKERTIEPEQMQEAYWIAESAGPGGKSLSFHEQECWTGLNAD
jgi:hypothetical protein